MPLQIGVGLTLQPDDDYLETLAPLFGDAIDYFEVTPETTWYSPDEAAKDRFELRPNGFFHRFLQLGAAAKKPFVAHGIGLSIGGVSPKDAPRRRAWLLRLGEDQRQFHYRWYTEHLGVTAADGQALALPMPLLMDRASIERVARRLRTLSAIVPDVGLENTAQYFLLGDPLAEPEFLRRILRRASGYLLLDLHNLYTMAENLGFAAADYLDRLDLGQVIAIHLSGGSYSDGSWLPSQRVLRLDSHDSAVPKAVWQLFEAVLPRCANLRGVTLERMEGTVAATDVVGIGHELRRIRKTLTRYAP